MALTRRIKSAYSTFIEAIRDIASIVNAHLARAESYFGIEIDILQEYGSGTDYTDTTISAAITDIGSTAAAIVLAPGTWIISNNLTIPSNIAIRIPKGAIVSVNSGKTLTINGLMDNALNQKFSGSGTVLLGWKIAYPEWWGAIADGITDCYAAIMSAITALRYHGTVQLSRGVYVTSDSIIITDTTALPKSITINGSGMKDSFIFHTGSQSSGAVRIAGEAAVYGDYYISQNVGNSYVKNVALGSKGGPALYLYFSNKNISENVLFFSAGTTTGYLVQEGTLQTRARNLTDLGNDDLPDDIRDIINGIGRTTPRYGYKFSNGSYTKDAVTKPGMLIESWFYGCRLDGQYTREAVYAVADSASYDNIGQIHFSGCKLTGPTGVTNYGIVTVDGFSRGVHFADSCWLEQQGGSITVGAITIDNAHGASKLSIADSAATGYVDIGLYGGAAGTSMMVFSMTHSSAHAPRLNNAAHVSNLTLLSNSFAAQSTTMSGLSSVSTYLVLGNFVGSESLQNEGIKMGSSGSGLVVASASDTNTYSQTKSRSRGTQESPSNISDNDNVETTEYLAWISGSNQTVLFNDVKVTDAANKVAQWGLAIDGSTAPFFYITKRGVKVPSVAAADVPNSGLYIDSTSGVLSFKDSSGTSHALY